MKSVNLAKYVIRRLKHKSPRKDVYGYHFREIQALCSELHTEGKMIKHGPKDLVSLLEAHGFSRQNFREGTRRIHYWVPDKDILKKYLKRKK